MLGTFHFQMLSVYCNWFMYCHSLNIQFINLILDKNLWNHVAAILKKISYEKFSIKSSKKFPYDIESHGHHCTWQIGGTPGQARPARPQSGLDFQIHYHNVEVTQLSSLKTLMLIYRSGVEKISSGGPGWFQYFQLLS